jgi:hypothetical protein
VGKFGDRQISLLDQSQSSLDTQGDFLGVLGIFRSRRSLDPLIAQAENQLVRGICAILFQPSHENLSFRRNAKAGFPVGNRRKTPMKATGK